MLGVPRSFRGSPCLLAGGAQALCREITDRVLNAKQPLTLQQGFPLLLLYAGGMLLPFGGHQGYGLAVAQARRRSRPKKAQE